MSKHKHFEHLNLTYVIFYFQAMNVYNWPGNKKNIV